MVDSAINKVRLIPRERALKEVNMSKKNKRPVFAVQYDPRLPSVSNITTKHWRTMVTRNKYLAEVFPKPPLTAFRRQPNIRSYLIRAKLPRGPERYPKRYQKGMKKCNRQNCLACPFINETKEVNINGEIWKIEKNLNCNSYNVVYAIICKKEGCKETYIGETKRLLKFRLSDHRGYIVNDDISKATGQHFNSRGHSLADLSIAAIEQVKKNNIWYRKQREEFHIRRFNTFHKGLHRKI